jgi:hypothetical protein
MFSTVRLEATCADGSTSLGTGFFFNAALTTDPKRVYLCTNNHVLEDSVQIRFRVHISTSKNEPWAFSVDSEHWITINDPRSIWTSHPDQNIDLCAAPLSMILSLTTDVSDIYYSCIERASIPSEDEQSGFTALMPIAMIGYPTGLWDEQNNLPLFRMGTTASHPTIDFNGRAEVVIDMACFPGSSGSPVVFHDRQYFASATRFLGVLYAGPTTTIDGEVVLSAIPTKRTTAQSMMHLGYVIKSKEVLKVCEYIESRVSSDSTLDLTQD